MKIANPAAAFLPTVAYAAAVTAPLSLHDRIRQARERLRLTQGQVAEAVGVSLRTVGNWEAGTAVPRNRLGALEDVLKVDLRAEPVSTSAETPAPSDLPVGAGADPERLAGLSPEELQRVYDYADLIKAARGERGPQ